MRASAGRPEAVDVVGVMRGVSLEQQLHGAVALTQQHQALGAAPRVLDAAALAVVQAHALQLAGLTQTHINYTQ